MHMLSKKARCRAASHRSWAMASRSPPVSPPPCARVEYSRISKRQKHVMRAYGRWLALRQVCAHSVRCRPAAQLTGYTALRLWSLHGCLPGPALRGSPSLRLPRTPHCANGCFSCATVSSPLILTLRSSSRAFLSFPPPPSGREVMKAWPSCMWLRPIAAVFRPKLLTGPSA